MFNVKNTKVNTEQKCLSLIMLSSVIKSGKKYYPQMLLEECKYEIKKKIQNQVHLIVNLIMNLIMMTLKINLSKIMD